MILFLQAALFGAAQEAIVVYEGAETSHFVTYHPGNDYAWSVYIDFSPDEEAPPDDYLITASPETGTAKVRWKRTGLYYLRVIETDVGGCSNTKVLPVNVVSNNRTISFVESASNACTNVNGNGFTLPLKITEGGGTPLEETSFPLTVDFSVNGKSYSQIVDFANQVLEIKDEWITISPQFDNKTEVQLVQAIDVKGIPVYTETGKNIHIRTIYAVPDIEFVTFVTKIDQGTTVKHQVSLISGQPLQAYYSWSIDPPEGTTTDLSTFKGDSALILWNGPPGMFALKVSVTDGNGCTSETVIQQIEILQHADFVVSAGRDTTIGSCNPFQLSAKVEQQPGITYSYSWIPAVNLDDPTSAAPVFTPGNTTTFTLTVTNSLGISVTDTVTIAVSEILANAGDDMFMLPNTNAILDGTSSIGSNLDYQWTTLNGKIESGANTPNPVISSFGDYYLTVTDVYGCTSSDTVSVYRLEQAPLANDDYDTTAYRTETIIPVLANDTDPQNSLNPASLKITSAPLNGTAYVDFDNYTIHYRPNEGFSGNEMFEYEVCNTVKLCDKAKVYVLVTEYLFRIPNAFTPNGDGINDFFEIIGIDLYPGNTITIVNRWGNKVYEAKNYGIDTNPVFWDGNANTGSTFLGNELPTGTYYYILDLGNGQNPIAGSIYLDR
ncbi:MAG: gliding motility-associated C-terminal domain-containing protein [Bacteroidetes bacterium]|nr:MAG: gliding motility-associated C-terminal domain-containing protein [Bacteroidota bacterium]